MRSYENEVVNTVPSTAKLVSWKWLTEAELGVLKPKFVCGRMICVAFLQVEKAWHEVVWKLLEDTQLIGCSSEQKQNSLTWPLKPLAGALLPILPSEKR